MKDGRTQAMETDWMRLLDDPDLVRHLPELLRTYRDSSPEDREQALLDAMRQIKNGKAKVSDNAKLTPDSASETPQPISPGPADTLFEPSIFAPSSGEDRRRHRRLKCFVVVEVRTEGAGNSTWGTLVNVSRGGCLVETRANLESGAKIKIGFWVASSQMWVKGLVVSGIVARTSPTVLRIKFAALESAERETLRELLKSVETSAQDHGYLARLKR
jgi:hypothetical protein